MREKIKTLVFLTIVLSLTAVLLGNYLSFHSEDSDLGSRTTVAKSISTLENTGHAFDSDQDVDPCTFGFCHLGHCAVLLIPKLPTINTAEFTAKPVSFQKYNRADRALETPFLPPRLA